MSDLSDEIRQAGLLLQNPLTASDAAQRRMIIDWGFQQIDQEYPLDAAFAPLNGIRRNRARAAWEQVIRTNGRELRGVVAAQAVQELQFQLQRRQELIRAEDAERMRRSNVVFDSAHRTREAAEMANLAQQHAIERLRLEHALNQQAEEAASRRRREERADETDQQIAARMIEVWLKASGSTSVEQSIEATRRVNEEISRIRNDRNLSKDEQHLHIKTLLDTLPTLMRNMRPTDV